MILPALLLWLAAVILVSVWLMARHAEPEPAPQPAAPDPVTAEVDRWMHQWDRGRP